MASIYNVPKWDNSGNTGYKINSAVYDDNGKFWYALRDDASNNTPAVGSAFWNGYINITVDGIASAEPYFFWSPSYNVQTSHSPTVRHIQFGDGYSQRLKDGINNNLLQLSLSFESRTELEAKAILHFLSAREGYGPFYFKVPPPYDIIKRFVCGEYSSSFVFDDNYTIQCKFMEVS